MTSPPYGLISDLHADLWSAFASLDSKGRNTRLMSICHEIDRCCEEVKKVGGDEVWIAGDVFHTRGSVQPAVFNPVMETLQKWHGRISFFIIAGNHDLTDRESKELGSSIQMLNSVAHVFHKPDMVNGIVVVPWHPDVQSYKAALTEVSQKYGNQDYDLICHIGIDRTLSGIGDRGVTADFLADLGFFRVFSGHYHHNKSFGRGVFSIGAATHQTWSDVGTKAGFLICHDEGKVQWFASHAPSFIDITGEEDPIDLELLVDGNFVRARIGEATNVEVNEWREKLIDMGAKGVTITSIPKSVLARRTGVSAKSVNDIDKSVSDYIAEQGYGAEVSNIATQILREVRSV